MASPTICSVLEQKEGIRASLKSENQILQVLENDHNMKGIPGGSLVPYSRFPVIKNKKSEECIEIIKLPSRHLYPLEGC